jgi:hypothetical protein
MKTTLETIETKWHGVGDIMVHNGQLANPLNEHTRKIKALSAKRKKTDEDLVDLAKAEFVGSFYWDERFGPVIPTNNILATIINGAKKSKYGREAGLAIFVEGTPKNGDAGVVKLDYDGPRDLEKLWNGGKSRFINSMLVRVQASRVVRTRPVLPSWSLHFIVKFDSSVINRETVIKAMEDGGFYIGLSEYRPRWGRFEVEVIR